jgi:CPA2 family monovalent cation:H+ antiporter-2
MELGGGLVLAGGTRQPEGHAIAEGNLAGLLALTLGKIGVFQALVAFAGPKLVPWILQQAARTGSHELFTLSVLAVSLGIAYASATLFGVSSALGAFCAGVVLSKSELSHRAAEEPLPLQHAVQAAFGRARPTPHSRGRPG